MEKYIPDMDFDIMWEDECLGHITVFDEEIIRAEQKDCELWKRFIPLECEKLTIPLLASLFLERLWDENRADIDEVHRQLGVKYHNPFQMVLKTRGVDYDDKTWFRFKGDENLTWAKDIDPRLEDF